MDPGADEQPDREQLESRVEQLEQTVSKMLPDRRGVIKGLGAAAIGGAAVGASSGGASGQSAAGQVGTESEPVDVEAAEVAAQSVSAEDLNGALNALQFGDPDTDIGDSLQQAHDALPASGGVVEVAESGEWPLQTTFTISKPITLRGAGRGTVFNKTADIVGIDVNSGRSNLTDFELTSDGSDTSDGIALTAFPRGVMDNVFVTDHGADGIRFDKGNLARFRDIECVGNAQDGFRATLATVDNNGCFFYGATCRSNGRHGFNFEGDGSISGSRQHTGDLNANANGADGIHIETRNNRFSCYPEANTDSGVLLSTQSEGNWIYNNTFRTTDNGTGNVVWLRTSSRGAHGRALQKLDVVERFGMTNDNHVGIWEFTHPSDNLFRQEISATGKLTDMRIGPNLRYIFEAGTRFEGTTSYDNGGDTWKVDHNDSGELTLSYNGGTRAKFTNSGDLVLSGSLTENGSP